jgi:predicted O-methyltransferase YrrM
MKRTRINRVALIVAMGLTVTAPLLSQGRQQAAVQNRPPVAKTEAEKRILGVLDRMIAGREVYREVPTDNGRMLRLLAEAAGAKNAVEIGTSTG